MGALNHFLRGSTLLEVIVASVIFLVVFMISLETVTRLTVRQDEGFIFAEAEGRIRVHHRELSDGRHTDGTYRYAYDWGEVVGVISPYRDFPRIRRLTLTATVRENRKRIEYNYLVVRKED